MNRFLSFALKRYIILVCIYLIYTLLWKQAVAQEISGRTLDASTKKPIPFVTIGVKNKDIGTVSDSLGNFRLEFLPNEIEGNDSLFFSSVQFRRWGDKISVFKNGTRDYLLEPVVYELTTVTITPEKGKIKTFGNKGGKLTIYPKINKQLPKESDEKSREQAMTIRIAKDIYLQKIAFQVHKESFKHIVYRINFYDVKNGIPGTRIVKQDIVCTVTGDKTKRIPEWHEFDLSPYNIHLQGFEEIAVGLEILERQSFKDDSIRRAFYIPYNPSLGKSSFFRMKGEAKWEKLERSNLCINTTALVLSKEDYKERAERYNNKHETSDSLDQKMLYGNNSGKFIKLKNAEIYYEIYGKGEPLFLLHGNNEGINSFREQIGPLAKHFRVIAIDTRGQGNSVNFYEGAYTYQLFSKDLIQVMDSLHIEKANILGWSDGGNTGLATAMDYPERVNRLAVMGANAFSGTEAIEDTVIQLFEERARKYQSIRDEESVNEFKLAELVLKEPHFTAEDLNTIRCPTLILAGEKDVIKRAHTEFLHKQIPHSEMVILPDADHYAPIKASALFNRQVLDFFLK